MATEHQQDGQAISISRPASDYPSYDEIQTAFLHLWQLKRADRLTLFEYGDMEKMARSLTKREVRQGATSATNSSSSQPKTKSGAGNNGTLKPASDSAGEIL